MALVEGGVEHLVAVLAITLGGIEGDVGLSHQLHVGARRALAGDADGSGDLHLVAADHPALAADLQDLPAEAVQAGVAERLGQDAEFVAAQPRQHRALGDHSGHGGADLAHQLVAGLVAQGVVDGLEAVEVHHQHVLHLAIARQAHGELLDEALAVQTAGQGVVVGGVAGEVETCAQLLHLELQRIDGLLGVLLAALGLVRALQPVGGGPHGADHQGRLGRPGQEIDALGYADRGRQLGRLIAGAQHDQLGVRPGGPGLLDGADHIVDRPAGAVDQEEGGGPAAQQRRLGVRQTFAHALAGDDGLGRKSFSDDLRQAPRGLSARTDHHREQGRGGETRVQRGPVFFGDSLGLRLDECGS